MRQHEKKHEQKLESGKTEAKILQFSPSKGHYFTIVSPATSEKNGAQDEIT